jgi:hypothetical protein
MSHWIKAYDLICREASMLSQGRQTMPECEQIIHTYLCTIGI